MSVISTFMMNFYLEPCTQPISNACLSITTGHLSLGEIIRSLFTSPNGTNRMKSQITSDFDCREPHRSTTFKFPRNIFRAPRIDRTTPILKLGSYRRDSI